MPPQMMTVLDARKPDDAYFIRSRGSASFFKVTSVDQKPLTSDQANEFAKREVRVDIGRKGAEEITKAALADLKFEGDYARTMTPPAPAAATPAPASDGAGAGTPPSSALDGRRGADDRDSRRRNPEGAAEELTGLCCGRRSQG